MAIFDDSAEDYDFWYESPIGKLVDEVETKGLYKLLKPQKNWRVLDAGCGTGHFSYKLADKGCKVFGIDVSTEMLSKAISKNDKISRFTYFLKGKANHLPFPDNLFDAVICVTAFEFFKDKAQCFKELFRIVKIDGSLIIGTINRDSSWGRLYKSPAVRENTVFKYAEFCDKQELYNIHSHKPDKIEECLFFPPDIEKIDSGIIYKNEAKLTGKGGFLCARWKKK